MSASRVFEREVSDKGVDGSSEINQLIKKAARYRSRGRYRMAEKVIEGALNTHPGNEDLYRDLYNTYDMSSSWNKANQAAKRLVEINSSNPDNFYRLGRSFARLDKNDFAQNAYVKGLQIEHGMSIAKIIHKIESGIVSETKDISTEYMFLGGKNNLGILIHYVGDKKYFTKISRNQKGNKREVIFYTKYQKSLRGLKSITPNFIKYVEIDNIIYLTLEAIDGGVVADADIERVHDIADKLSSYTKKRLAGYPERTYRFQFRKRLSTVTAYSTKFHDERYNKRLLSSLSDFVRSEKYPLEIMEVVEVFEQVIIKNKLYELVNPDLEYSLLHGDFTKHNIFKLDNDKLILFDWSLFTIGPRFIDIATYYGYSFISYSIFRDRCIDGGMRLKAHENLFFIYSLILYYILSVNEDMCVETRFFEYIKPAFLDFKQIAVSNCLVDEPTLRSIQLKNELEISQRDSRHYKGLYESVIYSRSWRITSPLRKAVSVVDRVFKGKM